MSLRQSDDGSVARADRDLGFVTMLFYRENDFCLETVAQDLANFLEPGFNFFADGRSDFVVAACVFHVHRATSLIRSKKSDCSSKTQSRLSYRYFFTRRWCVLGIFISSRYFATVRRVTWIPCDWRMRVICSSVNGLAGSSSSMSFFTRRLRISSEVAPPSGPFTLSLKKYRSSNTPCGV